MDSKCYSWAWVTADRLLSHGACELLYAQLVPEGASTTQSYIYDGENTKGDLIYNFRSVSGQTDKIMPAVPIYCRLGLYIDLETGTKGVLVQWRELGTKG